jgi:hypothetical protein
MPGNIQTYTPDKADAKFTLFTGIVTADPGSAPYATSEPTRIDAKFFLKPIQDELLYLIDIVAGFTGGMFADKIADYTVLATENHSNFTNYGAIGTITFTLPTIAANLHYRFFRSTSQEVRIDAGALNKIYQGDLVNSGTTYFSLDTDKGMVELWCDGRVWMISQLTGGQTGLV